MFSTGTFLQWTINGFSRNRKHVRLSWSKETKIKIRVTSRFLFEPNTSILRKRIQIAIYFTCNTCSQSLKVSMMAGVLNSGRSNRWLVGDRSGDGLCCFYAWFTASADTVTSLGMGLMIRYTCTYVVNQWTYIETHLILLTLFQNQFRLIFNF